MTKPTFANLKLKLDTSIKEITFNDSVIEVKQYLSIGAKKDLIDITLQKSKENGFYNPFLVEVYFHLHMIYLYTNISFTEKQREDEFKIFDAIESTGLMGKILEAIPEDEYDGLLEALNQRIDAETNYELSIGAVISSFINDLPSKMEDVAEIMNNFSPENFEQAKKFVEFAHEVNNGQPIKMGENE